MRAVIEILAVDAADGTVKEPVAVVLSELLKLLLVLLSLCLQLPFGKALAVLGRLDTFAIRILRSSAFGFLFETLKLFFMKDTLDFALLQPLLARKSA